LDAKRSRLFVGVAGRLRGGARIEPREGKVLAVNFAENELSRQPSDAGARHPQGPWRLVRRVAKRELIFRGATLRVAASCSSESQQWW
jgi:hypothetical protein